MSNKDELTHAAQERLEFIERQLIFKGWVSRMDLTEQFGIGEAAATRDFKAYKELSVDNMVLNHTVKRYEINQADFKPVFEKSASIYISELKDSYFKNGSEKKLIEPMERISYLKMNIFSELSKFISNERPVSIRYRSLENDVSERVVIPHSFFDTDIRMYMRCFDRKRAKFSDFMVNRVIFASGDLVIDKTVHEEEKPVHDKEWNNFIELILVPHKNNFTGNGKACVEMDLDMDEGKKIVSVRRSLAPYWLNRWDVDCSKDGVLDSKKFQLSLYNFDVLNDISNNFIAPGYGK
ncbi:WYL domain-containing protein [Erwinia sp. SLM-02]|uniref:WYL domain-containing protein n=1 Tax=Erwinia sp. SLM-02 TaxID=3020057 RepID=UPI00307FD959